MAFLLGKEADNVLELSTHTHTHTHTHTIMHIPVGTYTVGLCPNQTPLSGTGLDQLEDF